MTVAHSYALDNALLILEILRRIPRRNYITSAHLREQVTAAGYAVSLRTVQRHLDAICSRFAIECDTRGKPFGYRWMEGAEGLKLPLLTANEAWYGSFPAARLAPRCDLNGASSMGFAGKVVVNPRLSPDLKPSVERRLQWNTTTTTRTSCWASCSASSRWSSAW